MLGGLFAAGVDGILEFIKVNFKLEGKPPFIDTYKPLPSLDKILLAGISAIPLAFNRELGSGSLAYGVGQLAFRTIANMMAAPAPSFLRRL